MQGGGGGGRKGGEMERRDNFACKMEEVGGGAVVDYCY